MFSCLDYCKSVFASLTQFSVSCLKVNQNIAVRLLISHVSLHWLPEIVWTDLKMLMKSSLALHGMAPSYMKMLIPVGFFIFYQPPCSNFTTRGDPALESVICVKWRLKTNFYKSAFYRYQALPLIDIKSVFASGSFLRYMSTSVLVYMDVYMYV